MKKSSLIFFGSIYMLLTACTSQYHSEADIQRNQIAEAAQMLGLTFTVAELDSMSENVYTQRENLKSIRSFHLDNKVAPALRFDPRPQGFVLREESSQPNHWSVDNSVKLPTNTNELAFMSISQLASLIKTRQISSTELTHFFLERLKKYGDTLECVISITEERALRQAKAADEALANGDYKGILHGIPFGIKDLFATVDYKTTWGAMPYKEQMIHDDATVVSKLEAAGAVLIAKFTLGSLAFGDVWYGGMTRNPWDIEQGSSGSSAGSASATAAGLVPFALGTETLGSIVSPSTRCGVTGLRPTFGRVSKYGAMALSWSMDKIGPIARSAEDCAIVFDAIRGADGKDLSVVDAPFNYTQSKAAETMKIAYIKDFFDAKYPNRAFDSTTLATLSNAGFEMTPISFNFEMPLAALTAILTTEAAAAFDNLTLSEDDDLMVRQTKGAWPNIFRSNRLIPAVEYINANRMRTMLMEQVNELVQQYDVILTPSYGGSQLLITNLTGQPCVVVPNGFNEQGRPVSISFLGNLYDEAAPLKLAAAYQSISDFHRQRPPLFVTP